MDALKIPSPRLLTPRNKEGASLVQYMFVRNVVFVFLNSVSTNSLPSPDQDPQPDPSKSFPLSYFPASLAS